MIRHFLRDSLQLSNRSGFRTTASYTYLLVLAFATVAMNLATRSQVTDRPDSVLIVVFLMGAAVILSPVHVRIEHGRLSLTGLAVGTAVLLLNPLDATLVGLSSAIPLVRSSRWVVAANAVAIAICACAGAVVRSQLESSPHPHLLTRLVALVVMHVVSSLVVALGFSIRSGEPLRSIIGHTFSGEFFAAYAYFILAALLTSYVLDGSALGYLLATIVFILSLALTDTIAGRRVRRVLESELTDADRHLLHSRAVEGVVHNLRNHMANAVGYLKEVDPRRLDPVDREAVEIATSAANDAVAVLRILSQGATPHVTYSPEPVELNELVSRALGMARPRARTKEIELGLRESPEPVKVKADPLLLREVITNLVNNAIDAAPDHGHVVLSTGRRSNGSPYFSVSDNGPGVPDEDRHHLFEPHFTTKETGTGLGLFMSYGIIREHQGQLSYNGSNRGAVFTVTLPPWTG